MLISFKINTYGAEWKGITEEQWAELREVLPALEEKKPDYCYRAYVADHEGIRRMAKIGLTIELAEPRDDSLMLVRLQNRIEALELKKDDTAGQIASGAAVHIHIPDQALLKIDEVCHLDDCCTNELQGYLNKGWRILAVCPPNAQRRPDYILGKRDPI